MADPQQAVDVARWRKVERERLIAVRLGLSQGYRTAQTAAIARALEKIFLTRTKPTVSLYWPIRAEPDFRPWMRQSWQEWDLTLALPVATALHEPLSFREWRPDAQMAPGLWKIPYPAEGREVVPDIVLAPLVGFDRANYRLGYGGGFFDRTLAKMTSRPLVIGVGFPPSKIRTIYPQPHDIPMARIVTGDAEI